MAKCLNIAEQPVKLSTGSTVGTFTGVEADQVVNQVLGAGNEEDKADMESTGCEMVPGHLQEWMSLGS